MFLLQPLQFILRGDVVIEDSHRLRNDAYLLQHIPFVGKIDDIDITPATVRRLITMAGSIILCLDLLRGKTCMGGISGAKTIQAIGVINDQWFHALFTFPFTSVPTLYRYDMRMLILVVYTKNRKAA